MTYEQWLDVSVEAREIALTTYREIVFSKMHPKFIVDAIDCRLRSAYSKEKSNGNV